MNPTSSTVGPNFLPHLSNIKRTKPLFSSYCPLWNASEILSVSYCNQSSSTKEHKLCFAIKMMRHTVILAVYRWTLRNTDQLRRNPCPSQQQKSLDLKLFSSGEILSHEEKLMYMSLGLWWYREFWSRAVFDRDPSSERRVLRISSSQQPASFSCWIMNQLRNF